MSEQQKSPEHKKLPSRYSSIAIILHWAMGLAIIGMLMSGFAVQYLEMDKSMVFKLMQLHKSTGVVLLMAIFLRFSLRMYVKPPALPKDFVQWERVVSKAGHVALYLCMFIMPISGWLMVSSSSYGLPTIVFGSFEWPHIDDIFYIFGDLEGNQDVRRNSGMVHKYVGFLFAAFIAVHIAAVVKHAVVDGQNVLVRMWWCRSQEDRGDV